MGRGNVMKKLKIAFVWDWNPPIEQIITWKDGLAAALAELENRGHIVELFTGGERYNELIDHPYFPIIQTKGISTQIADMQTKVRFGPDTFRADIILYWGDMTRPNAKPLRQLGIPMAICFAGGNPFGENVDLFDHIFVESDIYLQQFLAKDYTSVSVAFGTNTDLFVPVPQQPKIFDVVFPATFAAWKRHQLLADATKDLKSLAVGWMYNDHETECWQECLDKGTMVLPHVSADALRYLYAASKVCVIPSRSDGGSQRTVLEAMAMDIPVVVTDSDKFDFAEGKIYEAEPNAKDLKAMINMALEAEVDTRDYVVENWSHKTYADSLEKELLKLCE
jgi:glycosyltransferase involved in cell wall biosynthesis